MVNFKKILIQTITILSLFSTNNSFAQTKEIDEIELVQNFQLGTVYEYEVQKGKIDSRQPDTEKIKSSTKVEFKVLKEKNNLKQCSWKYGSTNLIGVNLDQIDEHTKKIMNVNQGIDIKFKVNNKGAIQEITNFEECKIYVENAFKRIFEVSSNKMTPENNILT